MGCHLSKEDLRDVPKMEGEMRRGKGKGEIRLRELRQETQLASTRSSWPSLNTQGSVQMTTKYQATIKHYSTASNPNTMPLPPGNTTWQNMRQHMWPPHF